MTDIALSSTHDLLVTADGTMGLIEDPIAVIQQRLSIKLQLFLGEWFLNTRLGFPYYRDVLVKNPDFTVIQNLLIAYVLDDPEVESVANMQMDLDTVARRLTVVFEAVAVSGETFTVSLPSGGADLPADVLLTLAGDPVTTIAGDYVTA